MDFDPEKVAVKRAAIAAAHIAVLVCDVAPPPALAGALDAAGVAVRVA